MALVLVLAALALISFLVLVTLTMARTEDRTSTADAEISDVRTLAELPAQIVVSQFRRATSHLGVQFTWASQPGMIRVYGNGSEDPPAGPVPNTPRQKAYEYYKLYSSGRMTENSSFRPLDEARDLQNWADSPALFTDLNQPVEIRPTQTARSKSQKTAEERKYIYPILDPSVMASDGTASSVDGFSITPLSARGSPVAMPVRWLYVLKDGKVVAPNGGSGPKASFGSGPSAENPIVGRIAFWADDECCKLNINTASEPAPWDTPRTNSKTDHLYAGNQPARNEFHRQSGHPAFTALSPVFKSFVGDGSGSNNLFTPKPDPDGSNNDNAFRNYVNAVHSLLPRRATNTGEISFHGTQVPAGVAELKRERLYATIDELIFSAKTDSNDRREQNSTADGGPDDYTVTQEDINKARFFLTTKNSSPETNCFNRPKMSLWTVQGGTDKRTMLDHAMCFAAASRLNSSGSVATADYFFKRESAWENADKPGSSQSDVKDLIATGQQGTQGNANRNNILHSWLTEMSAYPMPGYASSLAAKYGNNNRNQILTSMFDMLRWGVNIGQPAIGQAAVGGMAYNYLPPGGAGVVGSRNAEYSCVPLYYGFDRNGEVLGKGFGRFPTISEVAIVFVASEVRNHRTTKIQAFLVVQPFVPAVGLPAMAADFRYRIKWEKDWEIKIPGKEEKRPMGFISNAEGHVGNGFISRVSYNPNIHSVSENTPSGGQAAYAQFVSQFLTELGNARTANKAEPDDTVVHTTNFPFVSNEIDLSDLQSGQNQEIEFIGGNIEIKINPGHSDESPTEPWLQSITITVPNMNIAVPVAESKVEISSRFNLDASGRMHLVKEGDVVRAMAVDTRSPCAGDLRSLAAQLVVPAINNMGRAWFQLVPGSDHTAHTLKDGRFAGATDFERPLRAEMPLTLAGLGLNGLELVNGMFFSSNNPVRRIGDWDNGPPAIEDGPYVSRMEFGNLSNEAGTGGYFTRDGVYVSDSEALTLAPLRQMASAMCFGSLPSTVYDISNQKPARPWNTLLFCANPATRATKTEEWQKITAADHFGFGLEKDEYQNPVLPDHLWLENFWMPVVEPRPLSVGFSTEGKVNMNCEIMPFSWIKRRTALHGALEGVRIPAIHWQQAIEGSTTHFKAPGISDIEYRYKVNAEETAKAFQELRFKDGEIFRTPSEICEMPLVPRKIEGRNYGSANSLRDPTWQKTNEWWNGDPAVVDAFEATGDNTREAPYAQLYPRLCTRSNVFKVHFRVQLLKKSRSTSPAEWDETKDSVAAEYRGSSVVERYLDPNDMDIPDMMGTINTSDALDDYFRFRVVDKQPFAP